MVGTTKVRDAVGRQHFAVFHHVNVASEKHEASSHIIIFSGKPCNLVLVPPIYAGLLPVCLLYVCMYVCFTLRSVSLSTFCLLAQPTYIIIMLVYLVVGLIPR